MLSQLENKEDYYNSFLTYLCKTTEFEKKNNAEILTPLHICKEMIENGAEYIDFLKCTRDEYINKKEYEEVEITKEDLL